jgi:hypothetical protein
MKKWLLILMVCVVAVSCKWWHETFDNPAECAEWYLDELYEAAADGDVSKFRERANDLDEWEAGLSSSELQEVDQAGFNYGQAHPNKIKKIFTFAYDHGISLE